eukprot:TRINITY_DN100398_c0_g1_i1.p1 TRINITY_DN100398_c0_g1~~TRINITY_DN100398_c0_g1_i1.p1  ORF type:complete len:442 (-),score=33.68 TRINITY_DN100398_c0_g1_i1:68-1393(-)
MLRGSHLQLCARRIRGSIRPLQRRQLASVRHFDDDTIAEIRSDTPGCAVRTSKASEVIHFNSAGSALMPSPVLEAVQDWYRFEALEGGYEAAAARAHVVDQVYESIATLIHAESPEEIAYVENATRAWDMAFYSMEFQPGDRILTSMAEYCSNYIAFLHIAKTKGVVIETIPNDPSGATSAEALRRLLMEGKGPVKLVAVTHIPTNGGLVNPVEEIGQITSAAGIPYLVDACQSVGQLEVDVQRIRCDALSATGRKYLRGPRGTGFLYARRDSPWMRAAHPPFVDVHAATWKTADSYVVREGARKFENWERNYAAWAGLGAAVDYALRFGMDGIQSRVISLAHCLREALANVDGVNLRDIGSKHCGIVTFDCDGVGAQAVQSSLADLSVHVTYATVYSTRLDMEARGLPAVVRASLHYYNTELEIKEFVSRLRRVLSELRT